MDYAELLKYESIYDLWKDTASLYGDKGAVIYLGQRVRFSELDRMVEHLSFALQHLGIRKGERVLIYLPNCPQWIIAWLAVIACGGIAVPISPIYTPADVEYIVQDSDAKIAFCTDVNYGYVAEVAGRTALHWIIVTNLVDLLPWWKKALGRLLDRVPKGDVAYGSTVLKFIDLLNRETTSQNAVKLKREDCFELLYTGGTTGAPKGVPIHHSVFLDSIYEQRMQTEAFIPKGTDIVVQGGPFFHILGQAVGIGALLWGDTLIVLPRVNIDGLMYYVEQYRATTLFGVPALYRMILEHDRVDFYNLSSLKYCFTGGDVLPPEVGERWKRKFGIPIYQGYGTTETCGRVALTPMGIEAPLGSCGKITPLQQVLVVDPDTLEPLPLGSEGELLVSSENMVKSYWNKDEETRECFVEVNGRVYYRTRDIVKIDEQGWLYFLDRSADVIKHKGYRVAASEIEAVLQEHPCVMAACAVGIPDEKVGERIKAFVVLREDVKGISAYDLIKWCKERLAPYKVPHYIEFRDMLPKSKVGKTLRRELRDEERRKLQKS